MMDFNNQVALTYTASIIVDLAAQHVGRPALIRSPTRAPAQCWGPYELGNALKLMSNYALPTQVVTQRLVC